MQGVPSSLIAKNESWVRKQAQALARHLPSNVEKADLIHYLYLYEHGRLIDIKDCPQPPVPSFLAMRRTRQPIIWNTAEEGVELVGPNLPGTDESKSGVRTPIVSSDRVTGSVIHAGGIAREVRGPRQRRRAAACGECEQFGVITRHDDA